MARRVPPMSQVCILVFTSVGWIAVLAGVAYGGPNLILNPGFEEGPSPTYLGAGLHWETNDALPHPEVDVLTTTTRHSGSYAQWLKANSSWDLGMLRQVSAYNSVTAGKTYRVSAWIRTANVQNLAGWYVFGVWFFHDDVRVPGDQSESKMPPQETLNYDWREITWTVVAPAGANRIAAVLTRHTDGDAWYDDVSVTEFVPSPPEISISPTSFSHKILKGTALADDSFDLQNTGGGALNYTITTSDTWLTCVPAAGTSIDAIDPISIHYTTANLPVGRYQATVSISDGNAIDPTVNLAVSLAVRTPGDLDYDGDVDQSDFGLFQACYSGNGITQAEPACADALMDADVDVDQDDFAEFFNCMSGPNVLADLHCAD
jgi:hypothetical protein